MINFLLKWLLLSNFIKYGFFYLTSNKDETLHEFIDPCSLIKCSKDELCIAKDDLNAFCIKRNDVEMHRISKRQIPTFCGSNECRFGECEVFNSTDFVCHCSKGVTGQYCNKLDTSDLPCASNPCYGDSVCINLPTSFVCVCNSGRTGPQCKHHLSPCQCQNGGICISSNGNYECKCQTGFGGHLCQYSVTPFLSCQITGCLNDGICTIYSKCHCPPSYTGLRCESLITTTKSTTTTTVIPAHYNINVCYTGVCQNGGSCHKLGTNFGICICTPGFTGPYCNVEAKPKAKKLLHSNQNTSLTVKPTQQTTKKNNNNKIQPCPITVPNPCQNNGLCLFSDTNNKITCNCRSTYTGPFCNLRIPFCANSPCKNGGTCNQIRKYDGNCTCTPNFTGEKCDISLTCDPNPCKNSQPCLVVNGKARCFCSSRYKTPYCD